MTFERADIHKTLFIEKGGSAAKPIYTIGRMVRVLNEKKETFLEPLPDNFIKSPDLWYFDAVEFVDQTSVDRKDQRGLLGLTHIMSGSTERPTA